MEGSPSGTRYSVRGGGAVPLTCSPSASAFTPDDSPSTASVTYSASLSPVTITLGGATPDGSGGYAILVGQKCTPTLQGIPEALLNNTANPPVYSWSVTGPTFQSWTVSSDHSSTAEEDGPGSLNVAAPSWYWHEISSGDSLAETVSCTATVTPPAGQGSAFSVTVSQPVEVYVPDWTATGTGGYVKVNLPPDTEDYTTYEIYAGATYAMEDAGQLGGMNIKATVASPDPALFGDGSLQLVQLVTPREGYVTQVGGETTPHFPADYGEQGLDGAYPYGWIGASVPPGVLTYTTNDRPNFPLTDLYMISATLKHDFEDYLMYLAPGSAQPVTIARFIWNDNGTAAIPSTYFWRDYASQHGGSDSAGTVTPSGNNSTFLRFDEFPAWTQID